ncbi:hypothetical protein CMI42_04820 [Candidatus Pacearchaeota archaeon]|nr:hypothetical protein [Candidatus Pacearchaeota archaeon]
MKSLSRTRVIGGSLVVTIPKEIVREKSLQEGELVEVDVSKLKRDGFGMLKGIGLFTKEDKFKGQFEE